MRVASICLLAITASSPALARTKVAILNVRRAITATEDGKTAAAELRSKFAPGEEKLSNDQKEIDEFRDQLQRATASAVDLTSLKARLDDRIKTHRRIQEDLQRSFADEQKRVLAELGAKLMAVVEQLAKQKHFDVVLGDDATDSVVYWRSEKTDITSEVIRRYNLARKK